MVISWKRGCCWQKKGGRDFTGLFSKLGFNANETFTVIADNEGAGGVRVVSFENSSGNKAKSNVTRFLLAPNP